MDLLCVFFSVLCLLCLCERLFICTLWSPAGKGLTSWLTFVVSNFEFVTFQLVSSVSLTGHFQSFFSFSELFLIYPEQTVKLVKFTNSLY